MDTLIFDMKNTKVRLGLLALLFLTAISVIYLSSFLGEKIYAGASDNLSGYAWSSNIGWISFNCANTGTCATSNYAVTIDESQRATGGTGDFSGYAWSSNIGWVSFNRADTGNPPQAPFNTGSGPIAQIDWSTGNVTGWAKAIAGGGGGWDGWIKLSGGWANGTRLDTSLTPNEFKGYAWGSDVVGWVSLNCINTGVCGTSNYKVVYNQTNLPPVAPDFTVTEAYRGIPRSFNILDYGVTDPEGDPISIVSLSAPSEGSASSAGPTTISYTNTSGTDGQDSFTYTITDGFSTSVGTVTVMYNYCGDASVEGYEQCDGSSAQCSTVGSYVSGTATCTATCDWNVSSCVTACGDGVDNDGDGPKDAGDPGCWSDPLDSTTYDPGRTSENNCGNGLCEALYGETRATCPSDCKAKIEEF